jgi:hypothetical protein
MNRSNRRTVRATLFVAAALIVAVWQGVASASGKTNVSWTMHGAYTCIDPQCDTIGSGTAYSDSSVLGAMTWTNSGGGGGGVLVCPRNLAGVTVAETWVFTTQNGDTLTLTTDSDSLCFVSPQVATETATFHITGGTGGLSGASGSGTFSITDLTNPSNENGKFNATINLP